MMLTADDPRELLRSSPMSRAQKVAIAVTTALSALDGFDVLAVTLAAPGIVSDWNIGPAALGVVLSSGLVGMALGSLLLAPLADVHGRRTLLLLCLGLMAAGMAMSGVADGVVSLSLWRVVTGLGIGAMISVNNPLATEFANERSRDLAVSLMAVGYPVGGFVGGATAAILLRHFDWPIIFYIGSVLAIAMVPIVLKWLPEPLSFLIERPSSQSLSRANALLARFELPRVRVLPPPVRAARAPIARLFERGSLANTMRVTAINVLYVVAVYYVLSWIPQLVANLGFTPAEAASVSTTANLAGIAGGAAFGWLATYAGARPLAVAIFFGFAASTLAFSFAPADLILLRLIGAILGFFLFAGMCSLHAIVSRSFGDDTRASGAGFVLGIGRAGSALTPVGAGLLFAAGVGREQLSILVAAGVITAAVLLVAHRNGGPAPRTILL